MEPRAAPRPDQRTINRHTKQLWVAKLSLRIVSSVLCLPLIGCAAFMLSLKGPGAPVLPQVRISLSTSSYPLAWMWAKLFPRRALF